jgi:hypothetical protein
MSSIRDRDLDAASPDRHGGRDLGRAREDAATAGTGPIGEMTKVP